MPRLRSVLLCAAAMPVVVPKALAGGADEIVDVIVVEGRVLSTDALNALKTPTPILDVPQSLTIVTDEEILLRGFTSIGDLIDYTPGANTSQGEGHRDAVVFRGVRSTADFFIDGVRDDVQYYRPLYNLEQVEILRGPNALFFGRGGTGGILNRVTKKAVIGEGFVGGRLSGDSLGSYDVWLDANARGGERAAFRLNAMYEDLGGHRDFFDGERIGVNPTARIALAPATTLDLSYEYVDHERFIDRGIPTGADGRPVEAFEDIVFGDPDLNRSTLEAHLLRATLQHRFSDALKGRLTAFYGDYDKGYTNFYAAAYDEADAPDVVGLDGYVDTTRRENLILTGDLVGAFETGAVGHMVVAGLEVVETSNDNARFNPVWSDAQDDVEFFTIREPLALAGGVGLAANGNLTTVAFSELNDDTAADVSVLSAYLQDEVGLPGGFDLVLGLRYDRFEIDALDVPANVTRSRTDEAVSPRVGLVYKPRDSVSLYASYSESFLPRSGEQFATISDATRALDPDTFSNTELGVKWDPTAQLSLTAAVFEVEQSSPQVADDDPETLDVIDSEVTGLEASVRGQLTDRWSVSGGYSYLDGEIVDRQGPTGREPRELPTHMASLWNAFQVTEAFGLGLGVTHQSESFVNNANTAVLPSYTRFDAAAYYDLSDALRVQINVENAADTLYFPNAHSTHQVTVGAPLNARLTLSGRF